MRIQRIWVKDISRKCTTEFVISAMEVKRQVRKQRNRERYERRMKRIDPHWGNRRGQAD